MSQTTPDAPIMLDSTGQAIVAQLQRIAGGGGGGSVSAPEYDASIARYGQYVSYVYGDYCSYEDKTYRMIVGSIMVSDPPEAFDPTKWEEVDNIYDELSKKPGRIVYNNYNQAGEAFNSIMNNDASGENSHAEGTNTTASGAESHAEGYCNTASGTYSHVEGNASTASGQSAHAEGYNNKAYGNYSHAEGQNCEAGSSSNSNIPGAHAEGYNTKAYGAFSHSEGNYTTANGMVSHVEGGNCSTSQSGQCAHAEGGSTQANAECSHAEGYYSQANGNYSHAGGSYSNAVGIGSFASGIYAETKGIGEAAFGKFNASVDPTQDSNYILLSVGNGSSAGSRSNALEIRLDGTGKLGNKTILAIDPPTADGTYTLQCIVSNGVATYSWA